MEAVDSLLGLLVSFEVDETEALALALLIGLDDSRGDGAELLEELREVVVGDFRVKVLDVDVGELSTDLLELGLTLL